MAFEPSPQRRVGNFHHVLFPSRKTGKLSVFLLKGGEGGKVYISYNLFMYYIYIYMYIVYIPSTFFAM